MSAVPPQVDDDSPEARLDAFKKSAQSVWEEELFSSNPARLKTLLGLTGNRDPFSEWHAYHELKNAYPAIANEIFLGLFGNEPRLVPPAVLEGHGYILGGTGTGKTSIAIAQLLIQVARGRPEPPPIIIIDLKPEGDRYLRGVADWLAAKRGIPLAFFSNRADYQSLEFDPLHALSSQPSNKAIAQTILQALIPIRIHKSEEVFFLNENRELLERVLDELQGKNFTFADIIEEVRKLSRESGGNREARGVHGALSDFVNMPHVRIDKRPPDTSRDIDFGRVFTERQIAYVHLDSQSQPIASRSLGRLMLSCLLTEAVNRKVRRQLSPDFFLFIDEFHELASENIANLLTVARSAGARCILSHQTTASLGTDSITDVLLQNTSLQMLLSPDDEAVVNAFQRVAGEKIQIRRGGSKSTSFKEGASSSQMSGTSTNPWNAVTNSANTSQSYQHGLDEGFSESWQEERVSALTPDMLADLDSTPTTALVRVRKQGPDSTATTPWRGISVLNLLYPFTREEKDQREAVPWPTESPRPREKPAQPGQQKKDASPKAKNTPVPPAQDAAASALEERLMQRDKRLKDADGSAPPAGGKKKRQKPS